MIGKGTEEEAGLPVNATTILALLTLLGGVLLISHKLSSDRPVASSGVRNEEISEQQIDTRLWEDPFGHSAAVSNRDAKLGDLEGELGELKRRGKHFRVLAVMVPGGPASEEREFRLRTRFAVVSALAESAYAPRHQAHIGIGNMDWPSTLAILVGQNLTNGPPPKATGEPPKTKAMFYAFEWYAHEHFVQHRVGRPTNTEPTLVLWLDEDQFGDFPIPRLDTFFRQLGFAETNGLSPENLALIGPSRSDTLKAMFPNEFDQEQPLLVHPRTNLTGTISLFLATPRAIDEVLVKATDHRREAPRAVLLHRLRELFHDPRNFAATDSDLARQVLGELKRRRVDLVATNQHHLVLIGGWDEYFGRMLSAAYAAELAVVQSPGINLSTFWEDYRTGKNVGPTNLHTFLYLSGLDGQRLSAETSDAPEPKHEAATAHDGDSVAGKAPRWTPDVNRAEGPAQYDYLGRLAQRIEELGDRLLREGQGTVSAIGIGGGDVYDTLLILQALRPRFPEALFFVTDLDARFWDPKEWNWSRNLIVVSGYGLSLHEFFQRQTAPFRDSMQTAQFAAALAALGYTNVPSLTNSFPVRRFEIGRKGPVNLSTTDDLFQPPLHPESKRWRGALNWGKEENRGYTVGVILLCGLCLAIALSRNFRRFTVARHQFLAEPLWLREEDLGGLEGFIEIATRLRRGAEPPSTQAKSASPASDLLSRHLAWLEQQIADKIQQADAELDHSLGDLNATEIFTESDILQPLPFLEALRGRTTPEAVRLHDHLPGAVKLRLSVWDPSRQNSPDLLPLLAEAIRDILNREELGPAPAPGEKSAKVRWRRNREWLQKAFPDLVRGPLTLRGILVHDSPELREALDSPLRRDALHLSMLRVLDAANLRLFHYHRGHPDIEVEESAATDSSRRKVPPVRTGHDLDRIKANREAANQLIGKLLQARASKASSCDPPAPDAPYSFREAAEAARGVSRELHSLCGLRWHWFMFIALAAVLTGAQMFHANLRDTASWPWTITGASVWPSNWLYWLAVLLGFLFIIESYFQLRTTVLETTRQCRLDYHPPRPLPPDETGKQWRALVRLWLAVERMFHPSSNEPVAVVYANEAWQDYQLQGRGVYRLCRTLFFSVAYCFLLLGVYQVVFGHAYSPLLREPAASWYSVLVWLTFCLFLFLSFWTIDAAFLCRWFILRISQGPTLYSMATREHFSRQRGQVPYHVLTEWIDVSVIALITERVGRLIYFPAVLFLLMILANNSLFYYFPWPPAYYVLSACNFAVAAACVVILQRAARRARDQSLAALQEKLNQLKAGAAATEAQKKQHDIAETEELLDDIRRLKKGAFGGFWGNPVVGALLLPSGGTAVIEILRYLAK